MIHRILKYSNRSVKIPKRDQKLDEPIETEVSVVEKKTEVNNFKPKKTRRERKLIRF